MTGTSGIGSGGSAGVRANRLDQRGDLIRDLNGLNTVRQAVNRSSPALAKALAGIIEEHHGRLGAVDHAALRAAVGLPTDQPTSNQGWTARAPQPRSDAERATLTARAQGLESEVAQLKQVQTLIQPEVARAGQVVADLTAKKETAVRAGDPRAVRKLEEELEEASRLQKDLSVGLGIVSGEIVARSAEAQELREQAGVSKGAWKP